MDVLHRPLLDDKDRQMSFFEVMPELFFKELISELKHNRSFESFRIETLDIYEQYLDKSFVKFKNNNQQKAFAKFNISFKNLLAFTENNFTLKGNRFIAESISKHNNLNEYQQFTHQLDKLCTEATKDYTELIKVLSKVNNKVKPDTNIITEYAQPKSKKTQVSKVGNKLIWREVHYNVISTSRRGLINNLWESRCKKSEIKNKSGTSVANAAVYMGLIKSANNFTAEVNEKVMSDVKDINRYLEEEKQIPMRIENKEGKLLIVIG